MKTYFATFGCKVNQCETENIKQQLISEGFSACEDIDEAELCIVNSCTVTSQSELKCRQFMHKVKRENPGCAVLLRGCMPQAFPDKARALQCKGDIDIAVGNASVKETVNAAIEYMKFGKKSFYVTEHSKGEAFDNFSNSEFATKTRAYLKIQDGCDQYCTYCIIPYARGHIRSKPLDSIRAEASILGKCGHKEIILVGINLCCYGKDFNNGTRLIDAIEAVCSCEEIERVRLGSIEPEMISDDDIDRMSKLEKLCPQFHLSLQSGCDKTLKAMNRKYTSCEYRILCEKLRAAFPSCAITTDIMVGFPGETQEDFEKSLNFVKDIGFADAHIFPYSQRSGTIAAAKGGQIDKSTKKLRAEIMSRICADSRQKFLSEMVGKRVRVLFEKENCTSFHQGYSENYTLIKIRRKKVQKSLKRESFYVIIEEVADGFCIGRIVD